VKRLIAKQFPARVTLFEKTTAVRSATLDPDTVARTRDPPGALSTGVLGGRVNRKWRFHDEVQTAIRPDEQRKILTIVTQTRHVEDSLRIFKQGVHLKHLSAGTPGFGVKFLRKSRTIRGGKSSNDYDGLTYANRWRTQKCVPNNVPGVCA
jgi:hypothetical protein